MKRIVFLATVILLNSFPLFSQTSPPSLPVIKSESKAAIFDSAEGGFRLDFPFKPTRTIKTVKGAYGETPTVNFQALSEKVGFILAYTDLPSLLKEKVEIETQLDGVKLRFLNMKNSRLLKEEEINIGGNFAKEYIFETDEMTVFTRGTIARQRFFQISFMAQIELSKLSASEKKLVEDRAAAFLNSFAITKLPDFVDNTKNLPDDFGITVEETIFKSKYLKLEMELPENWYFIENWDSDSVTELLREEIDSSTPKAKEELDFSIKNTKILLLMSKEKIEAENKSALLTLAVEKMPFPNTLPEVMVKYYQEYSLGKNVKITKPISTSIFGGQKFAWIEYFNPEDKTTERFYAVNIDGLMFEVIVVYKSQADLKKMLASLGTIKFVK